MKRTSLVALGMIVALLAIVVAVSQLVDGSSGSGVVARGEEDTDLTIQLDGGEGAIGALSPGEFRDVPAVGPDGEYVDDAFNSDAFSATGGGDIAPPLPEVAGRKIIRNASVSLSVEDVAGSVQKVDAIAAAAGGFVSESSVFVEPPREPVEGSEPPPRTQSATVTIRVPSSAYASVMNQLRGLAEEVQSETSNTSDVTEEFTDLEARLRNLEATEARYLELLDRAETIPDILTLQDRINGVRLEIERIQGRMNLLNDLGDLATIVVQLTPPLAVIEQPLELGWAQEVWDDAWATSKDALQGLGTAAIVVGVVLAWLAVPALAIAIGWRLFGPRRERSGEAGGGTTA